MAKRKEAPYPAGCLVGISSFSEEEYALLKQVALDADLLDDTYEKFRINLERAKKDFISRGAGQVIEVPLTVAEIQTYCLQTGRLNTGRTREALVLEILGLHFGNGE